MSGKKSFAMPNENVAASFLTSVNKPGKAQTPATPARPPVSSNGRGISSVVPADSPQAGYYTDSLGNVVEKRAKIVSFALRPSVYEKLKVAAAGRNLKPNALMNLILEDYLEHN